MISIFDRFDDPYIYGPLTDEDVSSIDVNHRMVQLDDGWYVGTFVEIEKWNKKRIMRPEPSVSIDTSNQ